MERNESIQDFDNRFLHLCYDFPKEDMDLDFFKKNFEPLVQIFLNQCESKTPDVLVLPTFRNCETPQISKEEPSIPFFPFHPPFLVPI